MRTKKLYKLLFGKFKGRDELIWSAPLTTHQRNSNVEILVDLFPFHDFLCMQLFTTSCGNRTQDPRFTRLGSAAELKRNLALLNATFSFLTCIIQYQLAGRACSARAKVWPWPQSHPGPGRRRYTLASRSRWLESTFQSNYPDPTDMDPEYRIPAPVTRIISTPGPVRVPIFIFFIPTSS